MSSGYFLHLRTSLFWHIYWHWVFWGSQQSMDWMVRVSTQSCTNVFSFRDVDLNSRSKWPFTCPITSNWRLEEPKKIASQTTVVSHGAKSKSTFSSNSAKWLSSPHQWPAAQHLSCQDPDVLSILSVLWCLLNMCGSQLRTGCSATLSYCVDGNFGQIQ